MGGKGSSEVTGVTQAGGTFVALCDVDASRAAKTYGNFPNAKRYADFRVMLEKEKGIDAVTVRVGVGLTTAVATGTEIVELGEGSVRAGVAVTRAIVGVVTLGVSSAVGVGSATVGGGVVGVGVAVLDRDVADRSGRMASAS